MTLRYATTTVAPASRAALMLLTILLALVTVAFASGCGGDGDTTPGGGADATVNADAGSATADSGARADSASGGSSDGVAPARDSAAPARDSSAPRRDSAPRPDQAVARDVGLPDAPACNTAHEGSYSAPFSFQAAEKLGSIVINKMACSGTLTAKVACGRTPVLQGTYTCNYSGGLVAFDKKQTGTVQAAVAADGSVSGTIKHRYSSSLTRSYKVLGAVAAKKLSGSGSGSLRPHPQSAVPWKVTFSF